MPRHVFLKAVERKIGENQIGTTETNEKCVCLAKIIKDFQDTKTENRFPCSFEHVFQSTEFCKLQP